MCTQKLLLSASKIWDIPVVKSDHEILQALKECAPTKKIETLKKTITLTAETLLEAALKYKNPRETIRFLLNTGIKPTSEDLKTALEHQNAKEVVELLINQMHESDLESAILTAIESKSSFEIIQLLINSDAPCEHSCLEAAERLDASQAIIDLVKQANKQWVEKSKAHVEKRVEELKQSTSRKRKSIEMEPPKSQPKYDYQLIFDMRPDTEQSRALAEKAGGKGIPTRILPVSGDINQARMGPVTHRSRVYIIAHGSPGADILTDDKGMKKTFQSFADIFSLVPKLKEVPKNNQRVKISLVVCYGATDGDKDKKSFAEKLSKTLASKGIFAEVVARKGKSFAQTSDGRKLIDKVHHVEGSKFSFITTDKDTTITPITYGPS
ncbi:MAG TPA: C80 family cysteine peptidase [Rhabdochlamydiaceae bacterium]|nr:C80 family cysteine peptidase [Rhabdochlamydiaceae bacterium]